jgi:hypothetical protein
MVGMTTAATSAAVASFSGLRGLAEAAGWPARLAWLLPVTIDAYAMTSARVWLAASTGSHGARRFARANALGAIAASTAGNAAYHAIGAGLLAVGWPIVVLVGAVPATVLGLTAHLHALRSRTTPTPHDKSGPEARTEDRTRPPPRAGTPTGRRRQRRHRTEAELIAAARDADTRHRAEHGRPITRDALRTVLRVSGGRATELRRLLAATSEPTPGSTEIPD